MNWKHHLYGFEQKTVDNEHFFNLKKKKIESVSAAFFLRRLQARFDSLVADPGPSRWYRAPWLTAGWVPPPPQADPILIRDVDKETKA